MSDEPAWMNQGASNAPLTDGTAESTAAHGASQSIFADRDDSSMLSCCDAQAPTAHSISLWATFAAMLNFGLFVFSFTGENYKNHGRGGNVGAKCGIGDPPFAFYCDGVGNATGSLFLSCGYTSSQLGWRMSCIMFSMAFCVLVIWALRKQKQWQFLLNVGALGLAVCTFIAMCVDAHAVQTGGLGDSMTSPCGPNKSGHYEKTSYIGICVWDLVNSVAMFYFTFLLFRFRKSDAFTDI